MTIGVSRQLSCHISAIPVTDGIESVPETTKTGLPLWITSDCLRFANTIQAMPGEHKNQDLYVDVNGCLTERVETGGRTVIVHYDDLPDSDVTTVNGILCTTALRTVIDIAPDADATELERIVRQCLDRGLFSLEEALARVAEPDMLTRPGAQLLQRALHHEERRGG